jgi:hypothetical protein
MPPFVAVLSPECRAKSFENVEHFKKLYTMVTNQNLIQKDSE